MGLRTFKTLTPRRGLYLCLVCLVILIYTLLVAYLDVEDRNVSGFLLEGKGVAVLSQSDKIDEPTMARRRVDGQGQLWPTSKTLRHRKKWVEDGQYALKVDQSCTPVNTKLYPFCVDKFAYVKALWNGKCFNDVHEVDGSDCSVMRYLTEKEPFCWHNSSYIVQQLHEHQDDTVEFNAELKGLLKVLSHKLYRWLRMRVMQMWSAWIETIAELRKDQRIARKRKKLKVLFYLGSMGYEPAFLEYAGHGGPVGELVQWTDTIASAYILGHDVTVIFNSSELATTVKGAVNECAPIDPIKMLSDYDVIFTDVNGFSFMRIVLGGSVIAHYRCKLRFLDSFGTEAEFNYGGYILPIPGGTSNWGYMEVQLQQIMTMYPHSPDNTFLGFVVGNVEKKKLPKKKNQAVVYGKLASYFQGHHEYLDLVREYFEVHATATGSTRDIPSYVVRHGILDRTGLTQLLQESKVFIGLGFPYEGPGPLDAIGAGAVFINPLYPEPKNRLNEAFFKAKPTLRNVTSQNPYMEDFVGEPYVYTVDIRDFSKLRKIFERIKEQDDLKPFIPREFTNTGMAERLHTLLEHQDFCDENAPKWPPLSSRQLFISKSGESCKVLCAKKGLLCEPSYFYKLNSVDQLSRLGFDCSRTVVGQHLYAPSYNHVNGTCHIQAHSLLFSCVAHSHAHTRLCPCRDYIKGQTALCRDCL